MQGILGVHGLGPHAALGEGYLLGDLGFKLWMATTIGTCSAIAPEISGRCPVLVVGAGARVAGVASGSDWIFADTLLT